MLSAILYKACRQCGHQREWSNFHRNRNSRDGLDTRCKPCKAPVELAYREKHAERKRQAAKEWRVKYPDRVAAHQREREAKWPEKHKARGKVKDLVRRGKIVKPTTCPRCETEGVLAVDMHAHHHDYSKPLEVEWICRPCHNKEHGRAY
jgi:hypothetical protein